MTRFKMSYLISKKKKSRLLFVYQSLGTYKWTRLGTLQNN